MSKASLCITSGDFRSPAKPKKVSQLEQLCGFQFSSCTENKGLDLEVKPVKQLQRMFPKQIERCFGAFTRRTIKKGTAIVYCGQLIRLTAQDIEACNTSYLYQITPPKSNDEAGYYVDAREMGDETRFVNHSQYFPNLSTEVRECHSKEKIYLVAMRDIKPGEQLLMDYGSQYHFSGIEPAVLHPFEQVGFTSLMKQACIKAVPSEFAILWGESVVHLSPLMGAIFRREITEKTKEELYEVDFSYAAPLVHLEPELSRVSEMLSVKLPSISAGICQDRLEKLAAEKPRIRHSDRIKEVVLSVHPDQPGRTPLFYAVYTENIPAVKLLLKLHQKNQCDIIHQFVDNGNTLFMELLSVYLPSPGYWSCIALLIEAIKKMIHDADAGETIRLCHLLSHQNKKNDSLLHVVFGKGAPIPDDIAREILSFYSLLHDKLQSNDTLDQSDLSIDPFNYLDEAGLCPLFRAMYYNDRRNTNLLIQFIQSVEFLDYSRQGKAYHYQVEKKDQAYIINAITILLQKLGINELEWLFSCLDATSIFLDGEFRETLIFLTISACLSRVFMPQEWRIYYANCVLISCFHKGWLKVQQPMFTEVASQSDGQTSLPNVFCVSPGQVIPAAAAATSVNQATTTTTQSSEIIEIDGSEDEVAHTHSRVKDATRHAHLRSVYSSRVDACYSAAFWQSAKRRAVNILPDLKRAGVCVLAAYGDI